MHVRKKINFGFIKPYLKRIEKTIWTKLVQSVHA